MTAAKRLFSGTKISCARGGRVLFQNLSFGLDAGDVAHVAGPNGAGKTSLLRLMAGVLPLAAGHIRWDGHDFLESGRGAHAERLAFLPAGDQGVKLQETAGENLAFWARILGVNDDAIRPALEKMDILKLHDTPARRLSAGQRKRLGLARVFLRPAKLWLLDEPLNGLDMHSYDLFTDALNAHGKAGGLAVVASHYAVEPPKHGKLHRIEVGYA